MNVDFDCDFIISGDWILQSCSNGFSNLQALPRSIRSLIGEPNPDRRTSQNYC